MMFSALCLWAQLGALGQSTVFTYQGHLMDGGAAANGSYDIQFTLKNAPTGGETVGTSQVVTPVSAVNGIFTSTMDFGSVVFDGSDRWMEMGVRPAGSADAYTVLSPRQKLTATPYALRALSAASATTLSGTITAGNIGDGTITGAMIAPTAAISVGSVTASTLSGDGSGLTNIPSGAVVQAPEGMVLIPGGTFTLGDSLDGMTNAVPVSANVSAFYMDVNEVSYSVWQSVYLWAFDQGYTDLPAGNRKAPDHPLQSVSWYDCVKWCNARSELEGRTPIYYTDDAQTVVYRTGYLDLSEAKVKWSANGYRLPTEAEWEKAARGGLVGQRFPWGNYITQDLANYFGAAGSYPYDLGPNGYNAVGSVGGVTPATSSVGSFTTNGYGLNDMTGNVFEWCWDWYATPYVGGTDPRGEASGTARVLRGGHWNDFADRGRCAFRNGGAPNFVFNYIGFRTVVTSN